MENLRYKIEQAVNLYRHKKFSEAESLSKKLLSKNPKVAFLYNLLGLILVALGKNDEAIKFYKNGIDIQPDYSMIYNNLASVYKFQKNYIKAENYYKRSIELDDKIPETQNNLGSLYVDLNKHDEAIRSYKKTISINSKFYVAHYNLGVLYKSLGRFKESKKFLDEAINLNTKFYMAHRALSQITRYQFKDKHIDKMKSLYQDKVLDKNGKMELAFALGKAFDDLKKYETAIKYYDEGNKIRRDVIKFNILEEKDEFAEIKKIFKKDFIGKYNNTGEKNSTPIFILGMPRSGTTLVEQIISSHPDVYPGDELNLFNDLIKSNFYKNRKLSIESIYNSTDDDFKDIGNKYIKKIYEISNKSKRVTDKLPINFKWVGFIKLILPDAKIVHCSRDPKDTCVSIYKNFFTNPELNYAYNFSELVDFYNLYNDLMKFWKNNFSESIIEIKYENLTKNPRKEIKQLIKSCNLAWNDNCMKFYKNKRAIKTASDTQARNKIFKTSIESWKNYEKFFTKNFTKLKI